MAKRKSKKKLPVIFRDTREKPGFGYNFIATKNCAGTEICKLDFGDYQVKGYPELIVIERKKSIEELCTNLGKERERFERELQKMVNAECRFKYVIVEDYYSSIYRQKFSQLHPNSIFESIHSLEIKYGVHFIFAGTAQMAQRIARSLLLKAHKYHKDGII